MIIIMLYSLYMDMSHNYCLIVIYRIVMCLVIDGAWTCCINGEINRIHIQTNSTCDLFTANENDIKCKKLVTNMDACIRTRQRT